MTTVKLVAGMKTDFMEYAMDRKVRNEATGRMMNYLTAETLERVFDFFVAHKLTADEKGRTYYTQTRREYLSCGYSGYSEGDSVEEMTENLFHDVWCQAEWFARGQVSFYQETTKAFFGSEWYNRILGNEVA